MHCLNTNTCFQQHMRTEIRKFSNYSVTMQCIKNEFFLPKLALTSRNTMLFFNILFFLNNQGRVKCAYNKKPVQVYLLLISSYISKKLTLQYTKNTNSYIFTFNYHPLEGNDIWIIKLAHISSFTEEIIASFLVCISL